MRSHSPHTVCSSALRSIALRRMSTSSIRLQPAGTVIPLFYTISGRFTGVNAAYTDAMAHTTRVAQYQLESSVSDCPLAHSYASVEMIDEFHYVETKDEGYNEVARRLGRAYEKVFNGGSYDGRGPIATSVSRSGAVLTVSFDLDGAASLTTRDGRDQALFRHGFGVHKLAGERRQLRHHADH